ncbi:TrmB family transcriptional regulator [Bacillus manliponensis]|uniref:TrmB family transcriptional regulator n=1 Tax=Bacillus manliponensis TaxID=574376 RepID=UPI003511F623
MEKILQNVQALGFNQYEAKSYVALVYLGPSTAYQISKQSGVPRTRIYEVLEALEEKGIVMKEEINGTAQYSPLPIEVFLNSVKQKWEETYTYVQHELKKLENKEPKTNTYVTTLKGEENILSFCRILLRRAEKRIIISIWDSMYEQLAHDFQEKQQTCSLKGIVFGVENPFPQFVIHRQTDYIDNIGEKKWFIISIDGKEMIYGHPANQGGYAFYTDDAVHISLLENYVWHDVLVNKLVDGNQQHLQPWISAERKKFFAL